MDDMSNRTYTIVVVLIVVLIIMIGGLSFCITKRIKVTAKQVEIQNNISDQIDLITQIENPTKQTNTTNEKTNNQVKNNVVKNNETTQNKTNNETNNKRNSN